MNLYDLFLTIQLLSIVVLFFTTIYLFSTWRNRNYTNLLIYSLTTLLNNLGYYIEMTGKTSGEILIGTKVAY